MGRRDEIAFRVRPHDIFGDSPVVHGAVQMQLGYAFRTWVPGNGVLECRLDEAQLQRVLEHNAISQHLLSELTERFLQEYDWSRAERTWPPGFSSE